MASAVLCQEDSARSPYLYIGGAGSLGPTRETAEIPIPILLDCGLFQRGSGLRWSITSLIEFPDLIPVPLQVRPGIQGRSGELRESVQAGQIIDLETGRPQDITVDNVLDYTQLDLSLAILARVPLLPALSFQGGMTFGRTVVDRQTQKQVAVAPATLLYPNGSRDVTLNEGAVIPATSFIAGIDLGLTYDLPISSVSTLSPEVMLSIPLTARSGEGTWRSMGIGIGAALRFGLVKSEPTQPIVVIQPDPPPLRLTAAIRTKPEVVQVRIDEYDSTEALPLLNQIFFEEGASNLSTRYHLLSAAESGSFSTTNLPGSALDVYYDILNIVGKRMQMRPGATLTINGYRNGRESEPRLARLRAESVKEYLASVWSIDPVRLKVTAGGLPPNPAREITREGFEENARVDLIPSDPNITRPIERRFKKRVATPPEIIFFPSVMAEAGVAEWTLDIVQDGTPWRQFRGIGALPDSIVWDWRSSRGGLPELPMRLSYRLAVRDGAGQLAGTDSSVIDVEYHEVGHRAELRVNDTIISSYSLLLFTFDSPDVSPSDQTLLRAISREIGEGAVVRLVGYTDSLGDAAHNRELANERARETARFLRSLVPSAVSINPSNDGGERERFPYTTPEGRSHCRTVIIEVRAPATRKGS